jgi:hypothetical protein
VAITPTRILDTRTDVGLAGPFVSGVSQTLQVTGTVETQPPGGVAAVATEVVPVVASSVVFNVTVIKPVTNGFLSIRPGDASGTPATSNINWAAGGANIANAVTVQLPTSGDINIFVNGTVGHVLIDVAGFYQAGGIGPKGDQGEPGPYPGVLPSGTTLTGVYSATGVATAEFQFADSPISFGFQFASAPSVVVVGISDTPKEAAAAGCPGTAVDPKADPGMVCIYEMGNENTALLAGTGTVVEAGGAPAQVGGYVPPNGDWGTATKYGTIVEAWSDGAGHFYSNGSWAATSP